MIYIFTGKPRAGKSYGAVVEAYREAIGGPRVIVMSKSMGPKVGELNALVQERFPEADFDPCKRFHELTDEQTGNFWCHRMVNGQHVEMPFSDLGEKATPTLYIIDEAHLHFDARRWKEAGAELTRYNSQHAKIGLGDTVIFVTQFPDLLDKRVRGFAQEFHLFRNLGFEKLFWFFRAPQRFLVAVYYGAPGGNQKPAEVHYNKIDMRIAACYDTSAGVGIVGRGAPEMKRRKSGVSWRWLIVAAVLAVLGVSYGPDWFMKHVIHKIRGDSVPASKVEPKALQTSQTLPLRPTATLGSLPSLPLPRVDLKQAPSIRSVSKYGDRWRIDLTDGRVFTDDSGGIVAAGRDWIRLTDGEIVFRSYPSVPRPPPQAPQGKPPALIVPPEPGTEKPVKTP